MGAHAAPGAHQGAGEEREGADGAAHPGWHQPGAPLPAGVRGPCPLPAEHPAQRPGASGQVQGPHCSGVPHGVCHTGGWGRWVC